MIMESKESDLNMKSMRELYQTVAITFALRSMYHMTLQVMPGQLIFGRDMVLNVQHLTD